MVLPFNFGHKHVEFSNVSGYMVSSTLDLDCISIFKNFDCPKSHISTYLRLKSILSCVTSLNISWRFFLFLFFSVCLFYCWGLGDSLLKCWGKTLRFFEWKRGSGVVQWLAHSFSDPNVSNLNFHLVFNFKIILVSIPLAKEVVLNP